MWLVSTPRSELSQPKHDFQRSLIAGSNPRWTGPFTLLLIHPIPSGLRRLMLARARISVATSNLSFFVFKIHLGEGGKLRLVVNVQD